MLSFSEATMLYQANLSFRMTYGKRLDQAISMAKSSRKALAIGIGVSEQAIGQVIRGDTVAFSAENSAKAAHFLRVDHFWLATGDGEARPLENWPFEAFSPSDYYNLDIALREEIEDRLLGAIHRAKRAKAA